MSLHSLNLSRRWVDQGGCCNRLLILLPILAAWGILRTLGVPLTGVHSGSADDDDDNGIGNVLTTSVSMFVIILSIEIHQGALSTFQDIQYLIRFRT